MKEEASVRDGARKVTYNSQRIWLYWAHAVLKGTGRHRGRTPLDVCRLTGALRLKDNVCCNVLIWVQGVVALTPKQSQYGNGIRWRVGEEMWLWNH